MCELVSLMSLGKLDTQEREAKRRKKEGESHVKMNHDMRRLLSPSFICLFVSL